MYKQMFNCEHVAYLKLYRGKQLYVQISVVEPNF